MNEITPDEPSAYDNGTYTFDWKRPMSPKSKFNQEERDIIIKCISIVIDDYYFDDRELLTLIGSDVRPRFAKIIDKIKNNEDLDTADGLNMFRAVFHVATFPMAHREEVINQFEEQLDVKMRHLYWFSSYIKNAFEV